METISAGNSIAKLIPPDTAKSNKKTKKTVKRKTKRGKETAMDKKNISKE